MVVVLVVMSSGLRRAGAGATREHAGANLKLPTPVGPNYSDHTSAVGKAASTALGVGGLDRTQAAPMPGGSHTWMRLCIAKGCRPEDAIITGRPAARFCVTHRILQRYPRCISEHLLTTPSPACNKVSRPGNATMAAAAEQPARV